MQYALTRAQRTSSLNTDDSWMYEDGHDEIVFSVDQPCQLLGVGLCGTEGAFTAELELLEVTTASCSPHLPPQLMSVQSIIRCWGASSQVAKTVVQLTKHLVEASVDAMLLL